MEAGEARSLFRLAQAAGVDVRLQETPSLIHEVQDVTHMHNPDTQARTTVEVRSALTEGRTGADHSTVDPPNDHGRPERQGTAR
jgi:hypothetical protein